MPVLIAWIGEMLLTVVGQLAIRMLIAVGVGFLANAAFSGAISSTNIQSMLGGAGPLLNWVGYLRIDQAMTVILSAWSGRMLTNAAKVTLTSLNAASGSSGASGGGEE